jgi:hypothetical protein
LWQVILTVPKPSIAAKAEHIVGNAGADHHPKVQRPGHEPGRRQTNNGGQMKDYENQHFQSRAILACSITALIINSSELALRDRDIKRVLYVLAQQDWRDHRDDDRQLELFPTDKYTTNGGTR